MDLKRRTVIVYGKTGRRACAIDDELASLLKAWKERDRPKGHARVIGFTYTDRNGAAPAWRLAFKKAGLEGHRPRVLRRLLCLGFPCR